MVKKQRSDLLSGIFGLDLRSLAAYRVALALFILFDLVNRAFDLTAHYTDDGVMPRAFAAHFFAQNPEFSSWNPALLSAHFLTGSTFGTACIFLLHGLAAIGLLFGFRTRLMTFIVWFLLGSLDARNPLVLSVGDAVLLKLLFFSIFLPLGARYSVDEALNTDKGAKGPDVYLSPSTAVYYLQFACIYFFSALMKSGPEWRSEGTALYYAFNFDQFALPLARVLLHYPALLKFLTFAAWWIELLGAFLLLIPHPLGKLAGIVLFGGLQVGIGLTLELAHNPWINCIVLLPFLPAWIWNRSRKRKRGSRPGVEIIYDAECGFCRKLVPIGVEFLRPRLIAPPRAAQGKELAVVRREKLWIVRDEAGADAFRMDGFVRVVSSSPIFFWTAPLLRSWPLRAIGEFKFRFAAAHLLLYTRVLSPLRFRSIRLQTAWWKEALAAFFFAGVLIYNIAWLTPIPALANVFNPITQFVRLDQSWVMFAPAPNRDDGWFVIEGRLQDASKVEAFRRQRQISYDKPQSAADFYPDERWRRFMINIGTEDFKEDRLPFSHYLCLDWNAKNSGGSHMDQVSIYFVREHTPAPGETAEVRKLHFFDYSCPQ